MKTRLFGKGIVLAVMVLLAFAVTANAQKAAITNQPNIFTDKQIFRAPIEVYKTEKFGPDAEITSDRRLFYSKNYIENSLLGVWSGGSRYTVGGTASVPDGWNIMSTYTGTSRFDLSDVAPGSGSTIYPGFPHSMYLENRNPVTGPGTTAYVTYSPTNGVSSTRTWYQQFAGKRVVFGAWVKKENTQAVASGVTTNFIRPFINTYSGAGYAGVEKSFAFGNYASGNEWTMLSSVTTVPAGATALEVGFAMNPTILAAKGVVAQTGDSVYICAPFLLIDPIKTEYIPAPQEVVFLNKTLNVWSGGSTFGSRDSGDVGVSLDLSVHPGWAGIIPDSAKAILCTVKGDFASTADPLHFYANKIDSGVTVYPQIAAGVASFSNVWIPISTTGTIKVDNVATVTGVTLWVHAVMMP